MTPDEIIAAFKKFLEGDPDGLSESQAFQELLNAGMDPVAAVSQLQQAIAGAQGELSSGFFAGLGPQEIKELQLSQSAGGQQQLFDQALSQFEFGGATPFAQDLAQQLFNPLQLGFQLEEQLFGAQPTGGDTLQAADIFPSFTEFITNPTSLGGGGTGFPTADQFGELVGKAVFSGTKGDVFGQGVEQFFNLNPNVAQNLAFQASGLGLNPFANIFQDVLQNQFTKFMSQGGTPFQFLQQLASQ